MIEKIAGSHLASCMTFITGSHSCSADIKTDVNNLITELNKGDRFLYISTGL